MRMRKHCHKCKTTKNREEFARNRKRDDGLQSQCKPCNADTARRYRQANPYAVAHTKRMYRERKKRARDLGSA